MITPHEQEKIQLLSDTKLYPQAVKLMRGVDKSLPSTQINGLLNVSLANTYVRLKTFIEAQHKRTTWRSGDRHIPEFYRLLLLELKQLEIEARAILKVRPEQASQEDVQVLYMLIAREFIQHILAENAYNAYLAEIRASQNTERGNGNNQGGPQRNQRNNRGPVMGSERA